MTEKIREVQPTDRYYMSYLDHERKLQSVGVIIKWERLERWINSGVIGRMQQATGLGFIFIPESKIARPK